MILAYHRPETIAEALKLLARENPQTVPLGGGTVLSRQRKPDVEVVDLQRLGLNEIRQEGQMLYVGAAVTLQSLAESDSLPEGIRDALVDSMRHEAGINIRQMATVAGLLASCDGRSPFATALLALDPRLVWAPGNEVVPLGDYLLLRGESARGRLMVEIHIPLNSTLRFETVARAPMDRPIVCAAVNIWPSGRTRVTLGGHGKAPVLAMDGPEAVGASVAAREAYHSADDEWASAAYRAEIAGTLVQRLVKR